jgi:hypothetical protein
MYADNWGTGTRQQHVDLLHGDGSDAIGYRRISTPTYQRS